MSSLYGSTKIGFLCLKKHIVHLGSCFLVDGSNLLCHHEWGYLICNEIDNLYCSKTLKAFREGEIQVLVSSDAMTRGMDVEGVRNVINYDMPAYIKTYIHRAGRTARAGQTGRCFTLLHDQEVCCSLDCLTDWGVPYGNKVIGFRIYVTNNSFYFFILVVLPSSKSRVATQLGHYQVNTSFL